MTRYGTIAALTFALSAIAAVALAQPDGGGPATPNHAQACADTPKPGGDFGDCVSGAASAFGKCVAEAAQSGEGNPTEACADLKPGGGPADGDEVTKAPGDPHGGGGQSAGRNPTEGLTFPPEQSGRDFGQQVSENARENGPPVGAGDGGQSAEHNPTTGQTFPPEQSGGDFGGQVAETARGDHGPPS